MGGSMGEMHAKKISDTYAPVSYTHLDVYKRQEQRVSQQKIFQARLVEGQSTKSIETENH